MEPRGCDRWQSAAYQIRAEAAKTSQNRCRGCDQLPRRARGKQGVCRGLPPVAGGPLPAKEGVDTDRRSLRLLLVAALRARALVATAAGTCLADHGSILPGYSFGRLRGGGRRDRLASVAA